MGLMEDLLREVVIAPVRAEVGRALGRVTAPVHDKRDEVAIAAARRVVAPAHAHVERLVSELADGAAERLAEALWPGGRRRRG
jgi:hypothetical protein